MEKQRNNSSKNLYRFSLRNWIQLGVFILTLAIGVQFYIHVHQAASPGPVSVARPPGVEGFLPIGALMGFKLFFTTGIWDWVHPAAMVILAFAACLSLLLRKSFCGWFCPVGTISEWLWRLGQKMFGRNYLLPTWLDIPVRGLKYALLAFFVYIIFGMSQTAILNFLESPYYKLSDVKMLHFFTRMSGLTAFVLFILVVASVFIRNFWCRYLCPYGALMGLIALISPTRIERNPSSCIDCKRCAKVCPYHLAVDQKTRIISPECSGCMACTKVCPVQNTLELKTKTFPPAFWRPVRLGVAVLCLFAVFVYSARITGKWESRISRQEFRMRLLRIDAPNMVHPKVNMGRSKEPIQNRP